MKYKVMMRVEAYELIQVEAENEQEALNKARPAWLDESTDECRRKLDIEDAVPVWCEDEYGNIMEA